MSISKISSVAITAVTALVLTSGISFAKSYDTHHGTMVRSSVPDNNASIHSLSTREFFERLQNQGG
jgi:hypothetical protein